MPTKKTNNKKNMRDMFSFDGKIMLNKTASIFLMTATVFMVVMIISAIVLVSKTSGAGRSSNTITVSGSGEVYAVPDIATISVSIRSEKADVATAQGEASKQTNAVIDALRVLDVAEKDIKTSNYSSNPRYEYRAEAKVCPAGADCPPGEKVRTLVGYEVSQTLSVKIRRIDDVGNILAALGKLEVDYINGPYFEIDDADGLKAEARSQAIDKAEEKARALAKDLGVRLVKIVNFSEDGNYSMYAKRGEVMTMNAAYDMVEEAMPAPEVPAGENLVTSNVSITYKIR